MKAFNEISALRRNANEFATFWGRYKVHTSRRDVDKHNACFGGDARFTNFKVVTFFESHSGTYGSSLCSEFGRFDADLAQSYMVRAMNCLREELFQKCAELMRADAATKVEEASKEVAAMQKALADCLMEATDATASVGADQ